MEDFIPENRRGALKEKFVERYQLLLGDKYEDFIDSSFRYLRKSIRVNTLKIAVNEIEKRLAADWHLVPIPWCAEGFWISHKGEKRLDIGNLPEHQLGYIYVQDASSMIPPVVMFSDRPDCSQMRVLDMCAAPGSKTTQIASYMENKGVLVANDSSSQRLKALGVNVQRMGVHNLIVSLEHGYKIANEFDRILVDAPCSGTGTIRKSMKVLQMWSPGLIKKMSREQKRLLSHAASKLAPGGVLVYSTCTLEPDENEAVVSDILGKHPELDLVPIELDIVRSDPVLSFEGVDYDPRVSLCLRILPQDNDSEGFFVAKFIKRHNI
ncbi:MAG: RsmB/NOP family class I SAM-dependent RNA methyltransferase [Candidatus Woesearchaeota archaeon]|nr:MAG: RsmB/NOP family class I SAM-dependent RNA methyltransferase [Candidatus Woesearchaeota archaeon]